MGAEALCRIEQCREENNYLTTNKMASNKEIGEQYGIHPRDVESAKYIFEIYDLEDKQRMDLYYLGDALRSLGYIPTLAVVEKLGGTKAKGEGFLNIDEFLPIVDQVSNLKDMGNLEVFVECLRLYDSGEQMDSDQVEIIMNERCDEEDEDGCIPYEKFLEKLCNGPHVEFFQSLVQ